MSDGTRDDLGRTNLGRQDDSGPRLSTLGAPSSIHEALYNRIMDDVAEMIASQGITLATVVAGTDTGRGALLIHIDDEAISRSVGVLRTKGVRYATNERVAVARTRGGRYIVLGPITSAAGPSTLARAVGHEDLHDDSVERRAIQASAVGSLELAGGAVTNDHITSVHGGKIHQNTVGMTQLAPGVEQAIQNAYDVGNHSHNFAPPHGHPFAPLATAVHGPSSPNYAPWPHTHSQYTHFQGDFVPLRKKEYNDRLRLSKLCVKVFGAGKANCGLTEQNVDPGP